MPTYSWRCSECEVVTEILCKIADRDTPPTEECMCEAPQWKRLIEAPNVVGKASYLDGQRKFHNHREAAKLKREARTSRSAEKKSEISAEINKLSVKQYDP